MKNWLALDKIVIGAICLATLAISVGDFLYTRKRLNLIGAELAMVQPELVTVKANAVFDHEIPRSVSDISRAASAADLLGKRNWLISQLWPEGAVPTGHEMLRVSKRDTATPLGPQVAYDLVQETGAAGVSRMMFVEGSPQATCLLIYHSGHDEGLLRYAHADAVALMRVGLRMQCDVLHASMPLEGDNEDEAIIASIPEGALRHDWLAEQLKAKMHPIKVFVEPIVVAMNWARARKDYNRIVISGRSGGGWMAGLVGAIVPTVTATVSINGSLPKMVRGTRAVDQGDWEQTALYGELDYGDLYLLSVREQGRTALYSWNKFDTCCFSGPRPHAFFPMLQRRAEEWGFDGLDYHVWEDPKAGHSIGPAVVGYVVQALTAGDAEPPDSDHTGSLEQ